MRGVFFILGGSDSSREAMIPAVRVAGGWRRKIYIKVGMFMDDLFFAPSSFLGNRSYCFFSFYYYFFL